MNPLLLPIWIVIGITAAFSWKGFQDYSFFEKYKFNVGAIRNGQQIRMITSGFLHADWMHFGFNMFTLYMFGPIVISRLGILFFVLIYLASLLVGNLLSFYFNKDNYMYSAIGASGAVSGIVYSAILFEPNMSLFLMFIPIPIPAYLFGIGYLLYTIYGMKSRQDNIGHDAHFGGAIGGYALTLFFAPWLIQQQLLMVILLAIPIVILIVLKKLRKI